MVKLGLHHVWIYLSFVFAKELTKLLSNLNLCLKDYFNGIKLLMRVARGDDTVGGAAPGAERWAGGRSSKRTCSAAPWRWRIGMYYSMAPNSCVLMLYWK